MSLLRYTSVFTVALLLGLSISVAQGEPAGQPDTYVKVVAYKATPMAKNTKIALDFGAEAGIATTVTLRDELTGKAEKFNSDIDALNFMAESGWVYEGGYVLNAHTTNPSFVYLMRMPGN